MGKSKRDILETEKMLERLASLLVAHSPSTVSIRGKSVMADYTLVARTDAEALCRISMTLRRWHELECGTDVGHIEKDEGESSWYFVNAFGHRSRHPDRERGAQRRLKTTSRPMCKAIRSAVRSIS